MVFIWITYSVLPYFKDIVIRLVHIWIPMLHMRLSKSLVCITLFHRCSFNFYMDMNFRVTHTIVLLGLWFMLVIGILVLFLMHVVCGPVIKISHAHCHFYWGYVPGAHSMIRGLNFRWLIFRIQWPNALYIFTSGKLVLRALIGNMIFKSESAFNWLTMDIRWHRRVCCTILFRQISIETLWCR